MNGRMGFDLPVGHCPATADLDVLVRTHQRPSRQGPDPAGLAGHFTGNHGLFAPGGARPATTWPSLCNPRKVAQHLGRMHV